MKIERCCIENEIDKNSDPPMIGIIRGERIALIYEEREVFMGNQLGYLKLKRISYQYKKGIRIRTIIEFDLGEGCRDAEMSKEYMYL